MRPHLWPQAKLRAALKDETTGRGKRKLIESEVSWRQYERAQKVGCEKFDVTTCEEGHHDA